MASWADVRQRLERALDELADDAFLVLGEPEQPPGPPRGLLRRREPRPSRYVQVRACDDGLLYAECVGSASFGGDWETTPAQHDRLCALGWYVPGQANPWGFEQSYPNYFRFDEQARANELVGAFVESLQVLDLDPDRLVWRQDH